MSSARAQPWPSDADVWDAGDALRARGSPRLARHEHHCYCSDHCQSRPYRMMPQGGDSGPAGCRSRWLAANGISATVPETRVLQPLHGLASTLGACRLRCIIPAALRGSSSGGQNGGCDSQQPTEARRT